MGKLRANLDTSGDASLQNAIQLAVDSLATIPPYGHREVSVPGKCVGRSRAFFLVLFPKSSLFSSHCLKEMRMDTCPYSKKLGLDAREV